jgi:adenylosuccinate synthase
MYEFKKELIAKGIMLTFEQWYEVNKTALEWGNLPRSAEDYYMEYVEETTKSYWDACHR